MCCNGRETDKQQLYHLGASISHSVKQLATGWTVGIESQWGAKFSAPVQTGPGAHTASYTMGTRSFPGGKAAGAWR
jgi:hypothetical protein